MAKAKKATLDQVYQLKITLEWSNPPIWRRVEMLGTSTLGDLHRVIQAVMPWEEAHLHEFEFRKPKRPGKEEHLKWMRTDGENTDALWGVKRYSDPLFDLEFIEDEWQVTLAEVAPEKGAKFRYQYDMGDSWWHAI